MDTTIDPVQTASLAIVARRNWWKGFAWGLLWMFLANLAMIQLAILLANFQAQP